MQKVYLIVIVEYYKNKKSQHIVNLTRVRDGLSERVNISSYKQTVVLFLAVQIIKVFPPV